MEDATLIVGLGNPGTKYERTRHNLGFMVLRAFASELGLTFKREWKLKGKMAHGALGDSKVHLLMPSTYMNLSGQAVQKAAHFYKVHPSRVLVVVDDIYIKFGSMRIRPKGSAGGHNGLKSIEACLGTLDYPRLRMGVGPQDGRDLPDGRERLLEGFVLANFTAVEQQELPQVLENGVSVINCWLGQDVESASQLAGNLSQTL
ncbi:MAG: Peptidyl-tRNA hydrolase [Chlamydiales bacterium]|nr:Peptidyl-tRNA hydrolase [Chlamydiales bacterium]